MFQINISILILVFNIKHDSLFVRLVFINFQSAKAKTDVLFED